MNNMNILIAPNAFKESMTAQEAAEAIYQGFLPHFPNANYFKVPLADGGNGTLACLRENHIVEIKKALVTGPLGKKIQAQYGIMGAENSDKSDKTDKEDKSKIDRSVADKCFVIEVAEVCGLHLIPKTKRNPLVATTKGIGELILLGLEEGYRRFIIALGGSGTCDVGIGLLSALGVDFRGRENASKEMEGAKQGKEIKDIILEPVAQNLEHIMKIDGSKLDPRLKDCKFTIAYDVENKLTGENGALLYAPQKGADDNQYLVLEKGISHFANLIEKTTGKPITALKGGGAAGGIAAGMSAFLPVKMVSGAQMMLKLTKVEELISKMQLIVTGEGQIDVQSTFGKAPVALAKLAKAGTKGENRIPVIALAGRLGAGFERLYDLGFSALFSIVNGPMSVKMAKKEAKTLLQNAASNVAALLRIK